MSDCVERQAAIDAIKNADVCVVYNAFDIDIDEEIELTIRATKRSVIASVETLPSAQPERKKGKWIDDGTELGFCCADCGITWDEYLEGDLIDVRMRRIPNFCPNCGSYMKGEDNGA